MPLEYLTSTWSLSTQKPGEVVMSLDLVPVVNLALNTLTTFLGEREYFVISIISKWPIQPLNS